MGEKLSVLITGSNGFIGSHTCTWFKNRGHYVIGLGRRAESISTVDEYICCDLYSEQVKNFFNKTKIKKIDAIIHLAADMRKEPYATNVLATNCVGTQRLLELCEEEKIPVFVQLSSLPVIGKPLTSPITEEHSLKPPTVYHITKRTQELLANYAYYTFGVRTVSFRISAPVGPRMNPKTIFPVFVKKAMNNEDLLIYGRGGRKQTYVHVNDIAQAIYKAINSSAQGVYNLGSDNLYSNYELAKHCIKVLNSSSKIVYSGVDDPMEDYIWNVSLKKIKTDIDYQPEIRLDEMILELYEYFKAQE